MFGNRSQERTVHTHHSEIGNRPWSKTKKAAVIGGVASALAFIFFATSPNAPEEEADTTMPETIGTIDGSFNPVARDVPKVDVRFPPELPPSSITVESPTIVPGNVGDIAQVPIAAFQAQVSQISAQAAGLPGGTGGGNASTGGLNDNQNMPTAVAKMMPDRNLFISMGTGMPCITEQPINTNVPGPFRCKVPTSVYSASGSVSLLDPGTWIVGDFSDPLKRGMDRAFGTVRRLETPQGCIVNIKAPVGDQMGTPGLDVEVDTHFWERFRGYAMIALLDAAGQAAAIGATQALVGKEGGDGNNMNLYQLQGVGRQIGQDTYGDDINIPSTGKSRQSRNIVITAMQDIDMRNCFSLRMKG